MTPAQFRRRVNAVTDIRRHRAELELKREEAAQYRAAWVCATIMNFAGKQLRKGTKVKPEDLIRKRKTEEEIARARSQLIKRHRLDERFQIYDYR